MGRNRYLLVALLAAFLAAPLSARVLEVTLQSGDKVQGDLVNNNARGLYLLGSGDRAYFYPATSIASVVDVKTGQEVTREFLDRAATPVESSFDDDDVDVAPKTPETPGSLEPQAEPPVGWRRPKRVSWIREVPAFKPGFGLDFGLSFGGRTPNTQVVQLWEESTPFEAGTFEPPIPASVDLAILYQPSPKLSFGGFVQWYPAPLGNEALVAVMDGYTDPWGYWHDVVLNEVDYNLTFGSLAYGAKVRMKATPKSRAALTLYAGQLSLVDAGYEVIDDLGLLYAEKYKGDAPYFRADIEFNILSARRGGLLLGIGYQTARVKTINYKVTGGVFGPGEGELTSLDTGNKIDVDFSGLRVGLTAALRF